MSGDGARLLGGSVLFADLWLKWLKWLEWLEPLWRGLLGFGGGLIVALTIYKLYLEIREIKARGRHAKPK